MAEFLIPEFLDIPGWNLCDLEFAFEQPLASVFTKCELVFAGGNLWHTAVHTGVRTLGGSCWRRIGSTNIFVHQQATNGKKVWINSYPG